MDHVESYTKDPLFIEAMAQFQRGEWDAGLQNLASVLEKYPLEHELRLLSQEMQLRAHINEDEIADANEARRKRTVTWIARLGVITLVCLGLFWVVQTYTGWIQSQLGSARQSIEQEAQQIEMVVLYNNAKSLLQANRPLEALAIADQIEAQAVDFPYLGELREQAEALAVTDAQYNTAWTELSQGDAVKALAILQDLETKSPNYKDTRSLISTIERKFKVDEAFAQANYSFLQQDWEEAIAGYEKVRTLDPTYETSDIEDKLFRSYLKAAEALMNASEGTYESYEKANNYYRTALTLRPQSVEVISSQQEAQAAIEDRLIAGYLQTAIDILGEQGDGLEAIQVAEDNFTKALNLRPNDPVLRQKVEMARSYLAAVNDFERSSWNEVIGKLEPVLSQDPEFASGTARQLLYEAYKSRGTEAVAAGDYFAAQNDFQNAAVLALQTPDSQLRLFEAQLKVAEVKGLLGEYEEAVRIYQSALEQVGIGFRIRQEDPALARAISNAETLANGENYRLAYTRYRDALSNSSVLYEYATYEVQEGDYLVSLARRFNTTVEAIASANRIDNPNRILAGQTLIIPSLPLSQATDETQP